MTDTVTQMLQTLALQMLLIDKEISVEIGGQEIDKHYRSLVIYMVRFNYTKDNLNSLQGGEIAALEEYAAYATDTFSKTLLLFSFTILVLQKSRSCSSFNCASISRS